MIIDDLSVLFDDKGRSLILRKNTIGAYSPTTSSNMNTSVDYDVIGFLLNYTNKERDGTQIQAGDRKAVLKSKSIGAVPKIGDFIVIGDEENRIIDVRMVEEKGETCVYSCQIRS